MNWRVSITQFQQLNTQKQFYLYPQTHVHICGCQNLGEGANGI